MPGTLGLAQWLVLAVAVQRLLELLWARRNTARLLAAGGIETGAAHYPAIVAVHAAWLVANFIAIPPETEASIPLLATFALLQLGRIWVMASLGPYWTTRVISIPGHPLTRRGPYRFMRHPNYAIVAAEIACLPLIFDALAIAILFSALNAVVLVWRIRIENRALEPRQKVRTL